MINRVEKIYMIILFILGIYLGFNLGLERSMYVIFGLMLGFFIGRLPTEDKQKQNGKHKKTKQIK